MTNCVVRNQLLCLSWQLKELELHSAWKQLSQSNATAAQARRTRTPSFPQTV